MGSKLATEAVVGPADTASNAARAKQQRRFVLVYAGLVVALVVLGATSLLTGDGSLRDLTLRSTLLGLRASRFGAALLVGAALAVGGLMVQGLFRNPLADSSVLGTTAGATLGGNVAVLGLELFVSGRGIHGVPPDVVLPLGCLAGALLALSVILALLRRSGDVLSVILTGFLLSSLFLSLDSLVTSLAQDRYELGRAVLAFQLGGLTGNGPLHLGLAAPLVFAGIGAAWFWARPLDLLLSGDDEATSLGVDVAQVRRYCVLWLAALTAGAVSLGGNLLFVGLLVPHALRPLLGANHRRLVPVTALGGAVFVAACDLLARSVPSRAEIPLGVITGLLGAPAFLVLLARNRREVAHG